MPHLKKVSILLLIISASFGSLAQISGPTSAIVNSTYSYSYHSPTVLGNPNWQPSGGTVMSQSNSGTTYTANIKWTTAGVQRTLIFANYSQQLGITYVDVCTSGQAAGVTMTGPTSICGGTTVQYSATPTNGGTSPYYVWKVNGVTKQSGSSSTYSTNQLVTNDVVSVTMTSSISCVSPSSATASKTITSVTSPVTVSANIDHTGYVCPGQPASFTVTVTNGGSTPTYEWYRGGSPVIDNQSSGATYQPFYTLQNGEVIKCYVTTSLTCISGGASVWSNSITISVASVPAAPLAANASAVTTTSLTANWNASSGATSYRLDVSSNNIFNGMLSGYDNLYVSGTSLNVTGLAAGYTFYYRVRAENCAGTSGNSASITTTTIPAPPTGLTATFPSASSFRANWATTTGAADYLLDVASSSNFSTGVIYNGLVVAALLKDVTGLASGTTYYFRVRARNASGTSAYSSTQSALTLPAAPTATNASSVTASSFTANWGSSASATSYRLDVSTSNTFSSFVSGYNNLTVSGTSQSVTGLSAGTTYYYRIRAVNGSGTSANSSTISQLLFPAAPAATAATAITTASFTAGWSSVTSAISYRLDVSTSSAFSTFVTGFSNLSVSSTSQSVTGLAASTQYWYRVRAVNATGTSANSGTVSTITLCTAPTANAATSVTTTSFTASWGPVSGAASYRLDVSTDGFSTFVTGYSNLAVTGTNQSVSGLVPGASYSYRVRAVNASGASANSATQAVTLYPAAPTATAATSVTPSSLTANWTSSNGATGYRLDVSTTSGFTSFVSGYNNLLVTGSVNKNVTGLSANVTYYYRVRAENAMGVSANSNVVSKQLPPMAPVATAATNVTASSFTANWNDASGVASYRLFVSTTSDFSSYIPGYDNLSVTGTSTIVTGLSPEVTYYYRLQALNASATSAYSNTISTTARPDQNYIRTITSTVEGLTTLPMVEAADMDQRITQYNYFDGLGRPVQTVTKEGSPLGDDFVQPIVYDEYGREQMKYLPFTVNNNETSGWFKEDLINATTREYQSTAAGFYSSGAGGIAQGVPYAKTAFEPSPLNRVVEQGAPGAEWQPDATDDYSSTDHTVKFSFETNGATEVLKWQYVLLTPTYPFGLVTAASGGVPDKYSAGQLFKNKTKDEDAHEVITFKDKLDRVILKRVQGPAGIWADTYYIYDDFGNLVTVIPPRASQRIDSAVSVYHTASDASREAFLKLWAFRYAYDKRGRMVMKQVPGAEPVYMVYDNRDRLVMTQDGNQRIASTREWTFTKYDAFNRPVLTGKYSSNDDLAAMQAAVDGYYANLTTGRAWFEAEGTAVHGYTNSSFPNVSAPESYLTVTYYDTYGFRDNYAGPSYDYLPGDLPGAPAVPFNRLIGQVTGTKTKVLGSSDFLWTVNYYDEKYRQIHVKKQNHKGGIDRVTTIYDFVGKVLESKITHTSLQVPLLAVRERTQYDHAGRVTKQFHSVSQASNKVVWIDKVNTTASGDELVKTGGGAAYDAGARTRNYLSAGEDGWFEVTAQSNYRVLMGLTHDDPNADYTSIDYAIYLSGGMGVTVYENGSNKGSFGTYAIGDTLRVQRIAGTMVYKKNGVTFYTSQTPSNDLLFGDVSLINIGQKITVARMSVGAEYLLTSNRYNELGQLTDKNLGGATSNYVQSVDYRYNIRGWLTSVNNAQLSNDGSTNNDVDDLFGMELLYEAPDAGIGNNAQFNGNISAIKWKMPVEGATALDGAKAYSFTYDPMNRLSLAAFAAYKPASASWTADINTFNESLTYDLNGNIKTLQRNKAKAGTSAFSIVSGKIDDLAYTYTNGNRLNQVEDAMPDDAGFKDGAASANEYLYDPNGNMNRDLNKGIDSIAYNYLNLPSRITFSNGNTIDYVYDATGAKLKQVVTRNDTTKTTDYIGNIVYEQDTLRFLSIPDGRVVNNDDDYEYQFMIKDHLGNVRVLYGDPFEGENLLPNTDCKTLDYFLPAQNVTRTLETTDGESYMKFVANQSTSTPGMITTGYITVQPGEKYTYKVRGYRANDPVSPAYLYVWTNAGDLIWPGTNLPYGAENEGWVFNDFTVPEGVTSIRLGVFWRQGYGLTIGDTFYLNEVALFKHQDDEHVATFEVASQGAEGATFANYHTDKINNSGAYSTTGSSAYLLSGSTQVSNQVIGPAKSLRVYPGDAVRMEVSGRYLSSTGSGTSVGTVIAGALQNAFGLSAGGATDVAYQSIGDLFGSGALIGTAGYPYEDPLPPKAFLNYILFDDNYVPYDFGYDQIDSDGEIPGSGSDRMSLVAKVTKPGYLYVYLSNENPVTQEVYFDDLKIRHVKGVAIQGNDYYPFGLTFNSYQRENITPQDYKYNSKEEQDELGLGWLDFGARMYMPDIGRWAAVDPLSEKYMFAAPYHFSGNNPILYIDDTGEDYSIYFEQDKNGNWSIRISATYYVKKGDEDSKKSAENAVKLWNNNSDYMLQTKDKEGNVSGEYAVSFDLKVMEVDDPDKEKQRDTEGKEDALTKDGSSNIYSVVDDNEVKDSYARGTTLGLFKIKVKRTDKDDAQAGPHEIGHTLGLPDRGTSSSSVMNGGNTGTTSVQSWDVRDIIKFAETTARKFPGNRKVSIHGSLPGGKIKPKK